MKDTSTQSQYTPLLDISCLESLALLFSFSSHESKVAVQCNDLAVTEDGPSLPRCESEPEPEWSPLPPHSLPSSLHRSIHFRSNIIQSNGMVKLPFKTKTF